VLNQRQVMENYNYYNDYRVRASMRRGVWSIVSESRGRAVIELDEDFVYDTFVDDFISEKIDELVANRDPLTDLYRMAIMVQDYLREKISMEWYFHAVTRVDIYGFCDKVNRLIAANSEIINAEFGKLFAIFEPQVDDYLKSIGIFDKNKIEVRTEFEVCDMCDGHGKVVNPSIDAGGLSAEDFYDDPDFREDYFFGVYDVICPNCNGLRVEAVPTFPPQLAKAIADHDLDDAAYVAERCAELRMGA